MTGKFRFVLLFFFLIPVVLSGQEDYEKVFLTWIKGEAASETVLYELEVLYNRSETISAPAERLYRQARISLILGQLNYFTERGDQSLVWLEKSRTLAERLTEMENRADDWRILSDAGSFLMIQKRLGYIIANSPKVQKQAEQALSLDSTNARASLIVAQGLMNAPPIFGGDKKKGVEEMEKLSRRNELSDEDRFYILMALAEAYGKVKNKDLEINTYQRILELYPGNELAVEKYKDLL